MAAPTNKQSRGGLGPQLPARRKANMARSTSTRTRKPATRKGGNGNGKAPAVKLDLAAAKANTGKPGKAKFTVAYLMARGVSKAQAEACVADYQSQPTSGLKSSYRKDIEHQLDPANYPDKQAIARKAGQSAKANKAKS